MTTTDGPVRWAVVGTSPFALEWIAPAAATAPGSALAAVVSRDRGRAEAAAARVGAPHACTRLEELPGVADAVFLVVPNRQHGPMAAAAARLGLHVVVEKPMAASVAEADAMLAAARDHGVLLAVAHAMAWAPPVAAATRLVADGAVGRVVSATATVSAPNPEAVGWRHTDTTEDGGGPLWDVGSHAVDALHRIVGPVERVVGVLDRTLYDYAAEDTATLLLRFAGGAHGVVQALFTCEQRALEVQGAEGRLRGEGWMGRDFRGELVLERPGRPPEPVPLERTNVFVAELAELSAALREGREPEVSGARGREVVAVIEAGIRSARAGRVVAVGDPG